MKAFCKTAFISAFWIGIFCSFFSDVQAIEIASQSDYELSATLNTWALLQELGNNLSGTLQSFTFRVSTSKTNSQQFDFTGVNTRIYDKDNSNSTISGCAPAGSSSNPLAGLTFNTTGVPAGYEDVTIDFSCRNFVFTPGHRYLIYITNANMPGGRIQFATTRYGSSNKDNFTGGGLRFAFDNRSCSPASYIWNSQSANSGCNILTSPKDDLYFSLTNTAPPPKTAVIFIPGIGGSELKANQDIVYSSDNGHGGNYSHAYTKDEKIWVNQDEAVKLGDDDYFDVLKLKPDGKTSEADIVTTGNLTSVGYQDIDSFFTDLGYEKNKNYFVFNYDWRKDVRENKSALDSLVDQAITKSGVNKVNLVVHSMGGLIARYYISDSAKASKVSLLIELGVPHLGAASAIKTWVYGVFLTKNVFGFISLGIPSNEIKDISGNSSALVELLPSNKYFDFYNNSTPDTPYPFYDYRGIDNNQTTGALNYAQTKNLLSALNYNMTVFNIAEDFHSNLDQTFSNTNGVNTYLIVGTGQPTLGQVKETYWITWPANLINKTEETYINGDDTVPLYSASLKNNELNLSGAIKTYFVEQTHGDLVSKNGTAMQTVKSILTNYNLPVEVKSEKITLEGQQISLDEGDLDLYDESNNHTGVKDNREEIETNIPGSYYSSTGNSKNVFVKKQNKNIKVKITKKTASSTRKTTNIKVRQYSADKISRTIVFKDVPLSINSKVEFNLNTVSDTPSQITYYPDALKSEVQTINSTVMTSDTTDQTPPVTKIDLTGTKNSTGVYEASATAVLTPADSSSGILKTEYSLDNGITIQSYTQPFVINTIGKTTILISSTDKAGNQEVPQSFTIDISAPVNTPAPTSSPASSSSSATSSSTSTDNSSSSTSSNNNSTNTETSIIISPAPQSESKQGGQKQTGEKPAVLGVKSETNDPKSSEEPKNIKIESATKAGIFPKELTGLLTTAGVVTITLTGLAFSSFKPPHK